MKKRKLTKKLDLNKSLIARLNNTKMGFLRGGTDLGNKTEGCTTFQDLTMYLTCDTYTTLSQIVGEYTCGCTEPTDTEACTSN